MAKGKKNHNRCTIIALARWNRNKPKTLAEIIWNMAKKEEKKCLN